MTVTPARCATPTGAVAGLTQSCATRTGHEPAASAEGLAAQQHLFQALARRSWDAALVVDEQFRVRYAAPPVAAMLGRRPAELQGAVAVVRRPSRRRGRHPPPGGAGHRPGRPHRALPGPDARPGRRLALDRADPDQLPRRPGDRRHRRHPARPHRPGRDRPAAALLRGVAPGHRGDRAGGHPGHRTRMAARCWPTRSSARSSVCRSRAWTASTCTGCSAARCGSRPPRTRSRRARAPERYEADYRHPDGRERVLQVTRSLLHHPGGPETLGWLSLVSDVTEARRRGGRAAPPGPARPADLAAQPPPGPRPAQDGRRPPAAQPRRHHRRAASSTSTASSRSTTAAATRPATSC